MIHNHAANGTASTRDPNGGVEAITTTPTLRQVCLELQAKVDAFLAEDVDTALLKGLQAQVREAIGVVNEALERYSIEELSLSYNGGKDCLVLLVLLLACLPRHYDAASPSAPDDDPDSLPTTSTTSTNTIPIPASRLTAQIPTNTPAPPTPVRPGTPSRSFPSALQSVYIVAPHPFAEVDAFVDESVARYHLELCRYTLPMRAALGEYLKERPRLRAVFVGTRRTDPHGAELRHFDPTDKGWPEFVRVHPVIDWHYAEIWAFIRHLGIPYLSLYDQGYTSLGGTEDTFPNPLLKKEGGEDQFRPAYELLEDNEERLGRDR